MYESSCSYAGALELKRTALKEEPWPAADWPSYRLHQSTFEQLKQSVEKAKAALQDRSGLLGTATAFGDFYGGQLGQDATSATLGFGRTSRTDESMLGSLDKSKTIGTEKLTGGLGKGYSTPTLSDTLRASKCTGPRLQVGPPLDSECTRRRRGRNIPGRTIPFSYPELCGVRVGPSPTKT